MNDPVEQTQEATQEPQDNKSIVPAVVRQSMSSGSRTVMRDSTSGRFAKSQKRLQEELQNSEKVEKGLQKILNKPAKDKDGNVIKDENGKPKSMLDAAAERLLEMILELKDEKAIGSSSKALQVLMDRALGKIKDSPLDRDALSRSSVKVVLISAPQGLPRDNESEKREPLVAPSWLVSENPKTNKDVIEDSEK